MWAVRQRILLVSYDPVLTPTRKLVLERGGYAVTAAEALPDALETVKAGHFDLAVVGHSIPHTHKLAVIMEIKNHHPVPTIVLLRHGERPVPEATRSVEPRPETLLETVHSLLGTGPDSAAGN